MDSYQEKQKAINFFNEKAREFKGEFSALFLSYDKIVPVTGENIANLINQLGSEFSAKVQEVLTGQSNFLGIEAGELKSKVKDAIKKPEPEEKKSKGKEFLGLPIPLAIGIGGLVLLIIIFVIIKKATK